MAQPTDLDRLRTELDELDRTLLATAARRNAVVHDIAAAKAAGGGKPLFDRQRERAVYERARTAAEVVGLPPALAVELMQVLVEHSHGIQEDVSTRTATAATDTHRHFVVVGGAGRMGRRLGRALENRGHTVDALDLGDERDRAEVVRTAEIIIVAVPMDVAATVVEEVGAYARDDALLCDINSLKGDVCAAMERTGRGEALGLHPMFGPTVHSLRRQKVVVCPVRAGELARWWRGELEQMGLELIETDPRTHDRMMAVVQVLVHFSTLVMGEALRRTGVSVDESLRFTSPIYRLELAFIGRLFAQNPDLYAEIEMNNAEGDDVRRSFLEAAETFASAISSGDRDTFRTLFDGVSRYFKDFAGEAMDLSDFIIDAMVKRP